MRLEPIGVLVVDPAPVAEPVAGIEDEDLRREVGLQGPGRDQSLVPVDGEVEVVFLRVLGDLRGRVVLADGQADERDAVLAELLVQIDERLAVAARDGALEREEDDDDRLLVLEVVEGVLAAARVAENEVRNLLAELGPGGAGLLGGDRKSDETQRRRLWLGRTGES